MDELVNMITQKTGISQDQAKQAVSMTLDFVKQKLPPQVAGQVDAVMSGKGGNIAGDAANMLGGMMGGGKK